MKCSVKSETYPVVWMRPLGTIVSNNNNRHASRDAIRQARKFDGDVLGTQTCSLPLWAQSRRQRSKVTRSNRVGSATLRHSTLQRPLRLNCSFLHPTARLGGVPVGTDAIGASTATSNLTAG